MKFVGLHTAVITPFDQAGRIDEDGLRHNLRLQLQHGVQGVVVLGTTGEAPTLTEAEKELVIKIAVQEVKNKAILTVGTGSYSTQATIDATHRAQNLGADAALIVTPYYNRPSQEGLYAHYAAISKAVSLPICLYNIPTRTGQHLQISTLERLVNLPTIFAIKEGSGVAHVNEIFDKIMGKVPNFCVLSADDAMTLPLMSIGGHGIISVLSNLLPGPMQALVAAAQKGDFKLAQAWHKQLLPYFSMTSIDTNPMPIKAAMQLQNMPSGGCRLPLCSLSKSNLQNLKTIINQLPQTWLNGSEFITR